MPIANEPMANSETFDYYENSAPYYGAYCDKINQYDLNVRNAAAEAIRNHPGGYGLAQLLDIYDWIKANIIYQSVPLTGTPYSPSETLYTKSGDCKNQAVLIASMVGSIGGTSKVVIDPTCSHAYAIVYFGSIDRKDEFIQAIANHYGSGYTYVKYFYQNSGIWVIFDPAGGNYVGDTLAECSGNRTVYYVTSCMSCAEQYPNSPYTYDDYCYSSCPAGTISVNQHACNACPAGEWSYNNQCVTCPDGYVLHTNGRCYSS